MRDSKIVSKCNFEAQWSAETLFWKFSENLKNCFTLIIIIWNGPKNGFQYYETKKILSWPLCKSEVNMHKNCKRFHFRRSLHFAFSKNNRELFTNINIFQILYWILEHFFNIFMSLLSQIWVKSGPKLSLKWVKMFQIQNC